MPYVLALVAALLVIPAVGLGLVAVSLAVAAGLIVLACAVALGATGSLLDWILAATAIGVSWPAARSWHRLVQRLKAALATAGPGFGGCAEGDPLPPRDGRCPGAPGPASTRLGAG